MGGPSVPDGQGAGPPRGPGERSGGRGRLAVTMLPPDLGSVAREAVVGFLRAASADEGDVPPGDVGPAGGDAPAGEDVAVRAAATSVATLDRIEAAAAKLEADIAEALHEQGELQARAGEAAENAVQAALEAWESAGSAQQASAQTRRRARIVGAYVIVAVVLLLAQLLIVLAFAASTG